MSVTILKSIDDIVDEFVVKLQQTIKDTGKKTLLIPLTEFETTFGFTINPNHWNWLPQRFKKPLMEHGVKIFKNRGRNYAEVWFDENN